MKKTAIKITLTEEDFKNLRKNLIILADEGYGTPVLIFYVKNIDKITQPTKVKKHDTHKTRLPKQ